MILSHNVSPKDKEIFSRKNERRDHKPQVTLLVLRVTDSAAGSVLRECHSQKNKVRKLMVTHTAK